MRILFYAINGVGLGHAARLSVLQREIQSHRAVDCLFFSNSRHVHGLFNCPGEIVSASGKVLDGFIETVETFLPDIVVCDTYWPETIIPQLRNAGIRTVLVMRMMIAHIMGQRVLEALESFDTVLLPHHPEELRWTYRKHPSLLRLLESLPIGIVGPIARRAAAPRSEERVIFTVGGGGEWPGASRTNRIGTFLDVFSRTSAMLTQHGFPKPALAAGPLLKANRRLRAHFNLIETKSLHSEFGPNCTVVSRGGYNTCWEAISAGSSLVLCGSHQSEEDVEARGRFLYQARLGRKVPLSVRALFDAIRTARTSRERSALAKWGALVNVGVPVAVDELLGGSFLRARLPLRPTPARNAKAAHVLVWPGPRVRNELGIYRDIRATGTGLHCDGAPPFLSDYLSKLLTVFC